VSGENDDEPNVFGSIPNSGSNADARRQKNVEMVEETLLLRRLEVLRLRKLDRQSQTDDRPAYSHNGFYPIGKSPDDYARFRFEEEEALERMKLENDESKDPEEPDEERLKPQERELSSFQTILFLYCVYRQFNLKATGYDSHAKKFSTLVQSISGYKESTVHKIVTTHGLDSLIKNGLVTKFSHDPERWAKDVKIVREELRYANMLDCAMWLEELARGHMFGEEKLKVERVMKED